MGLLVLPAFDSPRPDHHPVDVGGRDTTLASQFHVARRVSLILPDSVSLVRPVDLAVATDGKIVIVDGDDYDLKLFSPDGSLIQVLGRRGRDPGEFQAVRSATFTDPRTLVAIDHGRQVLSFFDLVSRDVREVPLRLRPASDIELLGNRLVVAGLGPWNTAGNRIPPVLHVLGKDGSLLRSIFELPPSYKRVRRLALQSMPLIGVLDHAGSVVLALRFGHALWQVDPEGRIETVIRLPAELGFRNPGAVLDSALRVANADKVDPVRLFPFIMGVVTSGDAVLVGYFSAFRDDRRLRYLLLDSDLDLRAGPLSPGRWLPMTSRADTIVALELPPTADVPHQIIFLVPK